MPSNFNDKGLNWLNENEEYNTERPVIEIKDLINRTIKTHH